MKIGASWITTTGNCWPISVSETKSARSSRGRRLRSRSNRSVSWCSSRSTAGYLRIRIGQAAAKITAQRR
jgi:hypothetical protein